VWVSGHSESREIHTSDLLLPTSLGAGAPRGIGEARGDLADGNGAKRQAKQTWADVPWRTIVATIGLVIVAAVALAVVYLASRVIVWVLMAGFFALVLARPVGWLQHRFHVRRGLAVAVVVLLATAFVAGLMALFVIPLRRQLVDIVTDLPGTVRQASAGQGQVGRLLARLGLQRLVRQNEASLISGAKSIEDAAPGYLGSVVQSVLAVVTVAVTTCLMLSQSTLLSRAGLRMMPLRHRALMSQVGREAASAVSGYMSGNLLISGCAGLCAFAVLAILRVPSPLILAIWVAFADLVPLVGATLGAIAAVIAAFFVSPTAGIIALVFFALYQQFENSVLTTVIMSRTVRVNPLVVLLSVLIGVELFGFVGALLAVPMAGAATVIIKEMWLHRPSTRDELLIVTKPEHRSSAPAPASRLRSLLHRK
jgi:predicted PurR-regulated permease PerM